MRILRKCIISTYNWYTKHVFPTKDSKDIWNAFIKLSCNLNLIGKIIILPIPFVIICIFYIIVFVFAPIVSLVIGILSIILIVITPILNFILQPLCKKVGEK